MSLKEWLLAKKKRREALKREKLDRKLGIKAPKIQPLELEPLEVEPPEAKRSDANASEPEQLKSRMTEEYIEFLKQEAAREELKNDREES